MPLSFHEICANLRHSSVYEKVNVFQLITKRFFLVRCACNHCIPMGEAIECLCCREIPEIRRRLRRHQCVTLTRKFKAVCLDRAVLEVALKQRRRRLPPAGDRDSRNRQAKPWHQKSGGFNFKSEYHLCITTPFCF